MKGVSNNLEGNKSNIKPIQALFDLLIFLAVMFIVRLFDFEQLGFWGNTLFKSTITVLVATGLLYYRRQSWKDLGLIKPQKISRVLVATVTALVGTIISIMIFEIFVRDLFNETNPAAEAARFGEMDGNISLFLSVIVFVWIESFLEELQDRGFSLNRFESLFLKMPYSTIIAVLAQAAIFGFRHSYDLSPRSITTGLVGLVFGIVYVLSGRNLWPLIMAHIILNTMSMIDRL